MNLASKLIANSLQINIRQIESTLKLLNEGATVPFIARYRKELTGSLDEVQIAAIRDLAKQLEDLEKRRETIIKSIEEQGKLTPELIDKLQKVSTMSALEDLYLPYKPKRKTRASIAKEKGLEPLAMLILEQKNVNLDEYAGKFIQADNLASTIEEALTGARDIIAEIVNEDGEIRNKMRRYFEQNSFYKSSVIKEKTQEGIKYKDYFEWEEKGKQTPSHRVLAMLRGEEEGFLKLSLLPPDTAGTELINKQFIKANNACSQQVELAISDSYKRLLRPSMETELRSVFKQKADEEAIKVFVQNARQLLMSAPLGQKNVLAIDPGFRTGCKVVCLDKQGNLLEDTVIYPHNGQGGLKDSEWKIRQLVEKYRIEAIAIGNGTAGRETEVFIRSLNLDKTIIVMVNESGASIYSASPLAREEFPNFDITVRGAISIGRRLMDPLAELVKIDPKSIGVGQYQHDVDQKKLQQSLDDTVMSCVNAVGVELNTASKQLLSYVSGLGESLAQNIVNYRTENGAFKNRESLKKVPRLGDKAFEQAAGFLRIHQSDQILDSSGVHPERYALVKKMARDLGVDLTELVKNNDLQQSINLQNYVDEEVGLPTLQDIVKELAKPGRDPREKFEPFTFLEGVNKIEDLKIGMKLKGLITNITNFGAFVDIGVHQDGLVHTSQMADKYVSNPNEIVKVSQAVEVTVTEVDIARKRISLSMKTAKPTKMFDKEKAKSPSIKKNTEEDLNAKLVQLKQKFK